MTTPTTEVADPARVIASTRDAPPGGSPSAERLARLTRAMLAVAALGLLARVALLAVSDGSNDADLYARFARLIDEHGLTRVYQQDKSFNHPPLVGHWLHAAHDLSAATGVRFVPIFKLPVVLADFLVAGLLWKIWSARHREGEPDVGGVAVSPNHPLAATAVAAYAWNLDAILVSAFHCNTDPVYAALCLLAVYLLEAKRWNFAAGLAMAAALNVKLLPLVLVSPLLLSFRRWRALAAFCAGVAAGVLPHLPLIWEIPWTLRKNLLAYRPQRDHWGVSFFLSRLEPLGVPSRFANEILDDWASDGRWVVMAAALLVGLVARRQRWTLYQTGAATFAAFLFLTPGFGVQYTVAIVPLLCAASIRWGLAYGTLAGLTLATAYGWYLTAWYPLAAKFRDRLCPPAVVLGLATWATLGGYLFARLRDDRAN